MTKLMDDRRKKLSDFDFLSWSDADAIEGVRSRTTLGAALAPQWQWNYDSEVAELRNLYEKGKSGQWDAEKDVDWSLHVGADEWMLTPESSLLCAVAQMMGKDEATQKQAALDELGYQCSQLLHGEQAALQICGQLTNVCEKMDEKWYAASQVIDEARHVEVFSKFLLRKTGGVSPVGPTLKTLLDILLEVEGPQKKTLGMQTLFEGTAVGIMDMLRTDCQNPLFKEILRRVELDEARHAAFGVLMMRRIVHEATEEERASMEDWAFEVLEALNANQQHDMLSHFAPKYGYDAEEVVKVTLGLENFAVLNSRPFMHTVVPNLRNLGLITERTEDKWREVGMLVDSAPGVKGAPAAA